MWFALKENGPHNNLNKFICLPFMFNNNSYFELLPSKNQVK